MTSRYSGSPRQPGSLVRSMTAIFLVVFGRAARKCCRRERPVEAHLEHADFFALLVHPVDHLVHRLGARTHDDDHPLGLGVSDVVEEVVLAADALAELLPSRR